MSGNICRSFEARPGWSVSSVPGGRVSRDNHLRCYHGFLPLLASQPEAVRAQIRIACDQYRESFGRALKESGYRNVPISPEWKNTFEKPKFAGLSWMRMD